MSKTRIATVGYLNASPLTSRLDRERYEVIADVPSAIAALLAAGEVDVALAPVVSLLDHDDLRIVPGLAIGADGPVQSVLLVAETPPEQWTEVVLDGESRTSQALTRVLLAEGAIDAEVTVRGCEPGTGVSLAKGTVAAMVIGDAALSLPERLSVRIDLAEAWKSFTGHPFVFACWVGRQSLSPAVRAHLCQAGEAGVAAIAEDHTGAARTYQSESLRYVLDDAALIGLRRFAALAHKHGLVASHQVRLFAPEAPASHQQAGPLLAVASRGGRLMPADIEGLRQASTSNLVAAADLRRRDLHANRVVLEHSSPVTLALPVDGDWVSALDVVRSESVVRVLPEGTAHDCIRAVALARLALEADHIDIDPVVWGSDLLQLALRSGASSVAASDDLIELKLDLTEAGLLLHTEAPAAVVCNPRPAV